MTLKYIDALRNARLDTIETFIGTLPKLRMYTGTPPANVADAASGTLLVEMALPSDWLAAASAGTKTKSGTWQGVATGTGTAGYWRIWDNAGTTPHIQGTVGTSAADIILDNTSIVSGQTVTINAVTITASNN